MNRKLLTALLALCAALCLLPALALAEGAADVERRLGLFFLQRLAAYGETSEGDSAVW